MEERSLTLTVLGVVIVTAIVGLVLLFTAAKTGAGVYGGALKGDPFPYTRYLEGQSVVETPGWETTLIEPDKTVFGGASEALVNSEPVSREVQKNVLYKRDPALATRTGRLNHCSVLKFAGNVYAPLSASEQQFRSNVAMGRTCFAKTIDGTPVRELTGDYGCCSRIV